MDRNIFQVVFMVTALDKFMAGKNIRMLDERGIFEFVDITEGERVCKLAKIAPTRFFDMSGSVLRNMSTGEYVVVPRPIKFDKVNSLA